MALIITVKPDEPIHIGADIRVTVTRVMGGRVRLAVQAPRHVLVLRGELLRQRPGCGPGGPQGGEGVDGHGERA